MHCAESQASDLAATNACSQGEEANTHKAHGNHYCGIFSSDEEYCQMIGSFFAEGLSRNEYVTLFPSAQNVGLVSRALESYGFDVAALQEAQRISIKDPLNLYGPNGSFNPKAQIEDLYLRARNAVQRGFTRLRIAAETSWCITDPIPGSEQFFDYEAGEDLCNFYKSTLAVGLCVYDTRIWPAERIQILLYSHPLVWRGSDKLTNFYFLPLNQCIDVADLSSCKLQNWLQNLAQWRRMQLKLQGKTRELVRMNEKLKREIEEREKVERAKRIAEGLARAKSEFLAVISHEIRTPLNGIVCMSKLLAQTPLSSEQKDYVESVDLSSQHLLAMLNGVLDFSKIESGKLDIDATTFVVEEALHNVLSLLRRTSEKRPHLSYRVDSDVPRTIHADEKKIKQILFNIAHNSIKFTPETGFITITVSTLPVDAQPPSATAMALLATAATTPLTSPEVSPPASPTSSHARDDADGGTVPAPDRALLFTITDTGIGIPKEKWALIFNSFSQVDSSTTRRYGGIGLGLALCQRLVSLMGGKIWLDSEEGRGSTFYFSIPFSDAAAAATTASGSMPALASSAAAIAAREDGQRESRSEQSQVWRRWRMLAVDDNLINRKVIARLLQGLGCDAVVTRASGEEALALVRDHFARRRRQLSSSPESSSERGDDEDDEASSFDVIFLDLHLAGMDGLQTAAALARLWAAGQETEDLLLHPPRRPPALVAVTGSVSAEDRRRCAEVGMEGFLTKPLSPDQLALVLDDLARRRQGPSS